MALRAPVFNTYGCREFMSLAGECENRNGMHVNAENVLIGKRCRAWLKALRSW